MRLVVALFSLSAACGNTTIFQPVGEIDTRRVDTAWATTLYELEPFAYYASDEGSPLYVRSMATPDAGLVVVPSKDRMVRGLDARDGRIVWELRTGGPNVARPVELDAESLLVASMDGRVYRINTRNGRAQWQSSEPGTSMSASPAVMRRDERPIGIFVTSIDGRLVALDPDSGAKRWEQARPIETELSMTGQAGATVVGDTVVTGFADGMVVAYAQEDGATMWSTSLAGDKKEFVDVDATPVLVQRGDSAVLVAACYKRGLFGLTPDHGDTQWSLKGEGFQTGVADGGTYYVTQANGRVWAIEGDTGKVLWLGDLESGFAGAPVASRKYLLVPSGDGLSLIDRGSGREAMRWRDGRAVKGSPELAFGTAYVVASSGRLYALDLY